MEFFLVIPVQKLKKNKKTGNFSGIFKHGNFSDKILIEIYKVTVAEPNRFKVANLGVDDGDVFVYGREVDDFHTVDYEAISMLNVSATQQLAKEVEQLKKENEILKAQVAKIADLERMFSQLQNQVGVAETVSVKD